MNNLKSDELKRFLLLYASQTGQAKAIAEEIADAAPTYGLKASLHCLSLIDKRFCIENETCVVFVVSTTGDGEPPDSASKFFRRINRHSLKNNFLEKLYFSLLGLGDSNYIKFCLSSRLLERRLRALSAKSFYPTGFGDDAFGIETGVDPWIKNLWPALQKQLCVETTITNGPYLTQPDDNKSSLNKTMQSYKKNTMDSLTNTEIDPGTISELKPLLSNFDITRCRAPKLPSPNLQIKFNEKCESKIEFTPKDSILHSSDSPLSKVSLIEVKELTSGEEVKKILELTLQFEGPSIGYSPGDSFGFICQNSLEEVELLLKRLNVLHLAHEPVSLHIPEASKRKLPAHISSLLSLQDVFLHCIEIRSVPKKILLRIFAESATSDEEKNCLLFLSSPEGSKAYTNCIRKPSLSVLDILLEYTTCHPSLESLIEYLPSLKPRFYSAASSSLDDSTHFKIVFNVLQMKIGEGRRYEREGVCTGWLRRLSQELTKYSPNEITILTDKLSHLNLNCDKFQLFIYKRLNNHFHLPENLSCPVIMIGPGTGVAPFLGYLQHQEKLMQMNGIKNLGETWLFYGCRFHIRDFLYKTELERLKSSGVLTHLIVSFSREVALPFGITSRYVHESIRQNSAALTSVIEAGGKIYVCGDAKHMAQDIQNAFIESFEKSMGFSHNEARSFVEKLQSDHRYVNDVWA